MTDYHSWLWHTSISIFAEVTSSHRSIRSRQDGCAAEEPLPDGAVTQLTQALMTDFQDALAGSPAKGLAHAALLGGCVSPSPCLNLRYSA